MTLPGHTRERRQKMLLPGVCDYCHAETTAKDAAHHLAECQVRCRQHDSLENANSDGAMAVDRVFQIFVVAKACPKYWMCFGAMDCATLEDVDEFLADEWFLGDKEPSEFRIGRRLYASDGDYQSRVLPLTESLDRVVGVGSKFSYQQSKSDLYGISLVVYGLRTDYGQLVVERHAQNSPPHIPCSLCGREAEQYYIPPPGEPDDWLCRCCTSNRVCSQDNLMAVSNSPIFFVGALAGIKAMR